mmetsp:Transcript_24451/g.61673  ORF Transcript_24451/g.61673 Transcript_24451/m.61673 type:complete len:238 (+) Transcript_24451:892-1605(+)
MISSAAFWSLAYPLVAAIISPVWPLSLAVSGAALALISASTTFLLPMAHASWRAVPCALLTAVALAPALSSVLTTSSLPAAAATISASKPFSSCRLTSTFFLIMSLTTSFHPSPAASISAEPPRLCTTVASAPFFISILATSFWLLAHATISAVSPFSPTALMSALPLPRSSSHVLTWPAVAATMRGVHPSFPRTSTSMPRLTICFTRSVQPSPANSVRTVPPSVCLTSMSAPCLSR